MRVRSMCLTAMMTVLLMIGAWITIPTVPPFTMQTFVLYAMLILLNGKQMTAAVAVYILLGAVGLPVLAGFQGGIGALLGPTGGYLIGFLLISLLHTLPFLVTKPLCRYIVAVTLGTVLTYLCAVIWYAAVFTGMTAAGIGAAAVVCVVPFVLPDIMKASLAYAVCSRLKRRIKV